MNPVSFKMERLAALVAAAGACSESHTIVTVVD